MPTSQRRPVNKHSKRKTHRCKTRNRFLHGLLFVFAALMLCFGLFLWRAALELNAPAESAVSVPAEDLRPVVGSTAAGFECYPAVPGRTWHQESFYFAKLLAGGMQSIGARLRGRGGVRYIYYLENDQKQLVENTYTQVRPERSFTLLEDVDCPAVLAEQCFVTNDEDVEHFGSEQGCKAVARIYYEAICAYFGTEPLPVK